MQISSTDKTVRSDTIEDLKSHRVYQQEPKRGTTSFYDAGHSKSFLSIGG